MNLILNEARTDPFTLIFMYPGRFWVEDLPLNAGTNSVTLCVTNAAGLSNTTNFCVVKSSMTLALTSVDGDLWMPAVNVSGQISDANASVWVNGVQGTNNRNGTWSASAVPVTAGGVASFDMSTIPPGGSDPDANINLDKQAEIVMEAARGRSDYTTDMQTLDTMSIWNWKITDGGKRHGNFKSPTDWSSADDTIDTYRNILNTHLTNSHGKDINLADNGSVEFAQACGGLYGVVYLPQKLRSLAPIMENVWGTFNYISRVKMILHTGGKGIPRQDVLVAITATAVEKLNLPPYARDIFPTDITIPDLGKTLAIDGWAFGKAANGATLDVTPMVSVPMYSFTEGGGAHLPLSTTRHAALMDTNPHRVNLGVGEEVDLTFEPPLPDIGTYPPSVTWTTTAGGIEGTKFTAPSNAANATVTANVTHAGETVSVDLPTFNVVTPHKPAAEIQSTTTQPILGGFPGAWMHLNLTLQPANVCFYRVETIELECPATGITDYFTYSNHTPLPHGTDESAGVWHPTDDNNLIEGGMDNCAYYEGEIGKSLLPPIGTDWSPGGEFKWDIQARWRILNTHSTEDSLSWSPQHFKLDSDGTMTIDKFGAFVKRTIWNEITPTK